MRRGPRPTPSSSLPVVLDASAAVELLLRTAAGREVERRLRGGAIVAPAHVDAEVLSALARLARTKVIDSAVVGPALSSFTAAPIVRAPIAPLLAAAWSLRFNVSSPDALYVSLAVALDAPILTADRRLARSPGLPAAVIVV